MQFDIITIFPQFFDSVLGESILKRAIEKDIISVNVHNLRQWTTDTHQSVDDRPYGGGPGMVMMIEPIYKALKHIGVYPQRPPTTKVMLTSASGITWQQPLAQQFSEEVQHVVLICGHYEGVDQRVADFLTDMQVSIGNYVLTGGELAAGVILDSITRLIPGVLGNPESLLEESHSGLISDQLEYPQYTRPAEFITTEGQSLQVPEVLLSGNHAQIDKWREEQFNKA